MYSTFSLSTFSDDRLLSWFHSLAVVSPAAVSMDVQGSLVLEFFE